MTLRIGNGCGFYGDWLGAPRQLLEYGRLDYLTLEYLAELTLSILARIKEKRSDAGYAEDFLEVVDILADRLRGEQGPRVITNAGGMNPRACAAAAGRILASGGAGTCRIGVVTGDDIRPRLAEWLEQGIEVAHLETGKSIASILPDLVSANAYLGSSGIVEALRRGADLVITGRVADASLVVGPARFHFGWPEDDWDRLAGAAVAGHLIECGAQVTGGYRTTWQPGTLADVGYPIAEIEADGRAVITKPPQTGGAVTRQGVAEQLVYEIEDPSAYITPDVVADFTRVGLEPAGADRVAVTGASGQPAPSSYKVSAAYRAGYLGSGELVIWGADALPKAHEVETIIRERTARAGFALDAVRAEYLGCGGAVPGFHIPRSSTREIVLRVAARAANRAAVERFTREFVPIVTSGPAGVGGYTAARQRVRPIYAFWPGRIERGVVDAHVRVEVQTAQDWASREG